MELRSLPSYTTERYYILSEIEEKATFYPSETHEGIFHLDSSAQWALELTSNVIKDLPLQPWKINPEIASSTSATTARQQISGDVQTNSNNICNAFYSLWDLRADSNKSDELYKESFKDLNSTVADLCIDRQSSICCIEVVVDQFTDSMINGIKKRIFDVVNWIRDTHSFGCIYVGICDSVGGAPALEAILDYANMIEDHNFTIILSSKVVTLRVVAVNSRMQDFLGHDPTREPDALCLINSWHCIWLSCGVVSEEVLHSTIDGHHT